VYHTVGASEPLFLVYVCFAFIFLKTNQTLLLFVSIAGACVTRIEGLALWGTIGLCYCLRFDILRAIVVAFDLIAPGAVAALHYYRFGDWKAYYRFNQGHNSLLHFPPFSEIIDHARGSSNVKYHISALSLVAPFTVGTLLLFPVSVPFAIFALVYLVFSNSLFHMDIYRYALPGYVFALIVGFDEVLASKPAKKALLWLSLPFLTVALSYAVGQMESNRAPPWFTEEAIRSPVAWR
jgi:hypothetical protein